MGIDLRTQVQILNTEIASLRQNLLWLNAWPEAGDRLLELMYTSRWDSLPISKTDFEWLPAVVQDAIEGQDIGGKYPAFFQKLLTNYQLRDSFRQALHQAMVQANLSPLQNPTTL